MARLTRLLPDQVDPKLRPLFQQFLEERGNIPNMFRTVAHRPELLTTLLAHFRTLLGPGAVPVALKEMVAVRVSTINDCDY